MPMKESRRIALILCAALLAALCACGGLAEAAGFDCRFASADEGRALLLDNEAYLWGLNQNDLDFRMQKTGATLEGWKAFAAKQVLDYTEAEKEWITGQLGELAALCAGKGYVLPDPGPLTFVKTTMAEECDAGGYTHGTQIYLGQAALDYILNGDESGDEYGRVLIAHELFHCLTRNHPDFRAAMYALLGFRVREEDYAFGPEVAARVISNPDVEHHNACATFHIGGREVDCVPVFTTSRPFQQPGDSFFDLMEVGLVPVGDLNSMYRADEAEDFWQIFGENTGYVVDPEETLADNFAYALVYGEERDWESPEIIHGILEYLRG